MGWPGACTPWVLPYPYQGMNSRMFSRAGRAVVAQPISADEQVRLRGFAMLVALGDQHAANAAWRRALDAAARRGARQPLTRPAGWLRRRVLRQLDGGLIDRVQQHLPNATRELDEERRATLRALGATDVVIHGLRTLSAPERAAVVAHAIERLDPSDLGELLGVREAAIPRVVARAVRHYVKGADAMLSEEPWARRQAEGDLARRVAAAADGDAAAWEGQDAS